MKARRIYTPGIYDLTNDEYHESAGISRSGIMEFKRSPKHYWYKYLSDNYVRKDSTEDMIFGSALHCYILEPQRFIEEYAIRPAKRDKLPEVPLLKDVGREIYDAKKAAYEAERIKRKDEDSAFYHSSLGKTQIDYEDLDLLHAMSGSIKDDLQALQLISDAQYEKSIYWIDPETQLLCKVRPDILHSNFIVDLKTTKDASYAAFQRDFYYYGYALQLGMMYEASKHALDWPITNFIDLAIEKTEPYLHAIYPIDEIAIDHGRNEFHLYLKQMKECFEKNEWPGYKVQTLSLPNYAKIEE